MLAQSILLTEKGFLRLKKEIDILEGMRFKKISNDLQHISHDDEMGSEYSAIMDELVLIEQKLNKLKSILRNSKVAFFLKKQSKQTVDLGAKVELLMDGKKVFFEIVDIMNTDPEKGKISNESPIGKALIGKKEGEKISILYPANKTIEIKKIIY